MTGMQKLCLNGNNLSGTIPKEWPEGMQSLVLSGYFCSGTCSGVVGVNALCSGGSSTNCIYMSLWYNCLNLTVLPPISSNNPWNWANSSNMYFGPQRTDCPVYIPPPGSTPSASRTVVSVSQERSVNGSPSTTVTVSGCGWMPSNAVWSIPDSTTDSSVVSGSTVQWDNDHTVGTVSAWEVLGKRCVVLSVVLVSDDAGWIVDKSASPLLQGPDVADDMDNVTLVVSDAVDGGGGRNATLWLCTMRSGGLSLNGLRSMTLRLTVRVGLTCGVAGAPGRVRSEVGPMIRLDVVFP